MPDLWHEAVERAARVEVAPRRTFNPGMALIAIALLLAALAGAIVVGAWLNRNLPAPEIVTYDNGMIVAYGGCGRLVSLDPISLEARDLVAASADCHDLSADDHWTRPAWSLDGSRLAYLVQAADGPAGEYAANAWVYDAATDEARQLDQCRVWCTGIDISPDGSLVAYFSDYHDGAASLVVIEVESGEAHRIDLTSRPDRPASLIFVGGISSPTRPVFSPDGTQIALPLRGGQSGVYLVDIRGVEDGTVDSPTLLYGVVDASNLAWSPDGAWVAFTQVGGLSADLPDSDPPYDQQVAVSETGIVVVRADGTESRIVATGPDVGNSSYPTWSPDSSSVAYLAVSNDGAPDASKLTLWTVAIDGGEPTQIYESDCCYTGFAPPAWSPDGEWIALEVDVEDNAAESGVVLLRADGSEVRYAQGIPLEPVWQPIPEH